MLVWNVGQLCRTGALAFAFVSARASPPVNHTGILVTTELHRATLQAISCARLVSVQINKSLEVSPAYVALSQVALNRLERLRLKKSIDPTWAALSHEADVELTRMRTKTTSFGEAVLGNFMAVQYKAVVASRIPNKSAEVAATRSTAVIVCADSLQQSLNHRSMAPTQQCIDAQKNAGDALDSENKRLDLEIEELQNELKG